MIGVKMIKAISKNIHKHTIKPRFFCFGLSLRPKFVDLLTFHFPGIWSRALQMATRRIEQSSSLQGKKSEKTTPLELGGLDSMMKFRIFRGLSTHTTQRKMCSIWLQIALFLFFACLLSHVQKPRQLWWNPNSCRYPLLSSWVWLWWICMAAHMVYFGRQVNHSKGPIKAEECVVFGSKAWTFTEDPVLWLERIHSAGHDLMVAMNSILDLSNKLKF